MEPALSANLRDEKTRKRVASLRSSTVRYETRYGLEMNVLDLVSTFHISRPVTFQPSVVSLGSAKWPA